MSVKELNSYAKAGAIANEVFTAIRTVFAFNGAQKELARYESRLDSSRKYGIRKSVLSGMISGSLWLAINIAYALGFWYGWRLFEIEDGYKPGKILLIYFCILYGVLNLGNATHIIGTLATARAAAYEVFSIIDQVSKS